MFIDTHAHLFFENFNDDLYEVIERAHTAGVTKIIVPGTDLVTSAKAIDLASKYKCIYAAVGVHPHDTKDWNSGYIGELEQMLAEKKVVAIGETGLDYYYDYSPKDKQIQAFREQLVLAIQAKKPVIIHNREADDDLMPIVREFIPLGLRGQFHCFAGTIEDAKELTKAGFFISVTGSVTFKNTGSLREIVKNIDLNNLLLETDCPFMTPVPFRGKRNEPAYLPYAAQVIADLKDISLNEVGEITSANTEKLFHIGHIDDLNLVYKLQNKLYINLTNRCNANCFFCHRKDIPFIGGFDLSMSKTTEPPFTEYIKRIENPSQYEEVVFCGYGEPTLRWDDMIKIAAFLKSQGARVRLNTNGHANFLNGRNVVPEMKGLIDVVSISLNSINREEYAKILGVDESMYDEMIKFAKEAKEYSEVVMSAVDIPEMDTEKIRNFVENEIGVKFRLRYYYR